jgi:hypothetical protein
VHCCVAWSCSKIAPGRYIDEDKDEVVLLTDADVDDCMRLARKREWGYVTLSIAIPGTGAETGFSVMRAEPLKPSAWSVEQLTSNTDLTVRPIAARCTTGRAPAPYRAAAQCSTLQPFSAQHFVLHRRAVACGSICGAAAPLTHARLQLRVAAAAAALAVVAAIAMMRRK